MISRTDPHDLEHKQKKVDIEQIEAYMKLTDCHFGLYFGEKLEVFYLMNKDRKNKAVSVTTIDWQTDNQAGVDLIKLLEYSHYDGEKLEAYCLENLEMNEKIEFWKTPQGNRELYDAISEKFQLSTVMRNRLSSIVKFLIQNPEEEITTTSQTPQDLPHNKEEQGENAVVDSDKPYLFSIKTLKRYIENLKSEKTKDIIGQLGIKLPITEITDLDTLYKVRDAVKAYEKSNGIHHTHSCAISRYVDYIKAGYTFQHMLHDRDLLNKKTKEKSERKKGKTVDKIMVQGTVKCYLHRNCNAKAVFDPLSAKTTVLVGSEINADDKSLKDAAKLARSIQIDQYCERKGNKIYVVRDIAFDTPSGASKFCIASPSNGWDDWKDADNRSLQTYRIKPNV